MAFPRKQQKTGRGRRFNKENLGRLGWGGSPLGMKGKLAKTKNSWCHPDLAEEGNLVRDIHIGWICPLRIVVLS